MIQKIEDFYTESVGYVKIFDAFVAKHNFVGKGVSDHICYKCASTESFESLRALFESESEYVFQSIISKRRIAVIKLKKGITTSLGEIFVLELSDQKPDDSQKEGFDHIEVYPVDCTYTEMVETLGQSEDVKKVERPHHTTHDIDIEGGFLCRCTEGPLIEKIKNSQMA